MDKFVPIEKSKADHSYGVARFMFDHAREFDLMPDVMYVLGLLHDVGYMYGSYDHANNGARFLESVGFRYFEDIAWHGNEPQDYINVVGENPPPELVLLWLADHSIDTTGAEVGFDKRLADIGQRYGVGSLQYLTAMNTVEWLTENLSNYKH